MATQMRIRWNRILAVILILFSPFIINWLRKSIHFPPFKVIPILGPLIDMPEAKALLLLAMLLFAAVAILRIIRK